MRFLSPSLKKDRNFLLDTLGSVDTTIVIVILHHADPALLTDHQFMIEAASRTGGKSMELVDGPLKASREFAILSVRKNHTNMVYIDWQFRSDKNFIVEVIQITQGTALEFASDKLKNDRDVVGIAIKLSSGEALKHASPQLKSDYTYVMGQSHDHPGVLKHADKALLTNKRFVLETIKKAKGGALGALHHADEALRADAGFMLEAVKQTNGRAMQFASDQLHASRDFVTSAVEASGHALEHAIEEFRKDRDIAVSAIKSTGGKAMKFVAEELKHDRDFAISAAKHGKEAIQHIAEHLKADADFVLGAARHGILVTEHAAEEFAKDVVARVKAIPVRLKMERDRVLKKTCEDLHSEVRKTTVMEDVEMIAIAFSNLCQKGTIIAIAALTFLVVFYLLFKYLFCPTAAAKS